MTFGPLTHTSPSCPTGTSSPVVGWTMRTPTPGTGRPQEPSTRAPSGGLMVMAPHVSVLP